MDVVNARLPFFFFVGADFHMELPEVVTLDPNSLLVTVLLFALFKGLPDRIFDLANGHISISAFCQFLLILVHNLSVFVLYFFQQLLVFLVYIENETFERFPDFSLLFGFFKIQLLDAFA
jgi:hypothetical protein